MKGTRSFAALALAGALVAGPTAGAGAASTAKVRVTLVEFKVLPSPTAVAAGTVTFVVKDAGKLSHEFVVLKTSKPAAKLPVNGMTAVETGRVGKIPTFGPGQSRTLTLTLTRGHYVLICNLPGHYKAGQLVDFTVR